MIPIFRTYHKVGWFARRCLPDSATLTVVVKGAYALRPAAEAVPCDDQEDLSGDLHADDDPERPLRYPSDFSPLKPRADVLLVGRAHAPAGRPADVVRVAFGVGGFSKTLAVVGDRRWTRGEMTSPTPFREMAISFENAYGGPGFARNPLGKGFGGDEEGRPLPNIEVPGDLIDDPDETKEPASFGPVPVSWPQRMSKAGTYDDGWLKKRKPAFPSDFDWTFFNSAPEDQQFARYLTGDETLRFENLHPSLPIYESRLPGVRIRCFLAAAEIPMVLDTLWADMDAEKLVLVWRGTMPVPSEDLPDDDRLLVVSERLEGPPKSAEEHVASMRSLPQPERQEPPMPEPPEPPEPPMRDREWCLERIRSGRGLRDLDLARTNLSDLDLRKVDLRGAILTGARLQRSDLSGADLTDAALAGADLSGAKLASAVLRNADLTGARLPGADLQDTDLEDADLSAADLAGANLRKSRGARASFSGADLSRANLSEASLPAGRFAESALTEADFRGADLREASWESARGERVAAEKADLTGLRASGARLSGSIFRSARAARSTWQGATLGDSIFERADLHDAEFEGAVLERANLTQADLRGARLVRTDLRSARLRGANLLRAGLEKADLSGADLSAANLFEADLLDAKTAGTKLDGANLKRTVLQEP